MELMNFRRAVFSLLLVFSSGLGFAHQTELSSSALTINGSSACGEVKVNELELKAALDVTRVNRDGSTDFLAIELRSDSVFNCVAINN
ncbi:MAG: hypothetical protein O3B03_00770 [Proteobacteria bacterium]|nr:hypothetical protein [Pseudomonadota bacterium]MDA1332146.1 hypothetical protein [Pseudomonadota bacterium]